MIRNFIFNIITRNSLKTNYRKSFSNYALHIRKFSTTKFRNSIALKSLENDYMYQVISKSIKPLTLSPIGTEVKTVEDSEKVLSKNFRINSEHNASDVVKAFKAVQNFCTLNGINVSDKRFDNLVNGLVDHCENLTDSEILELLICLTKYPHCDTYEDWNFHDIWSCLNDITCQRIIERDFKYLFDVADAWYQLGLGKIGDYLYNFIDYGISKAHKFNKEQLVKMFFFCNICRRKSIPFQYQEALEKYLNEFTVDEFGIIALGFFKSMGKIKLTSVMVAMMDSLEKEASTVNQVTLASILKALRYSQPGSELEKLKQMLDKLLPEIDRLSPQCCLHIATIGISLIWYHKETLEKASQKIVSLMHDVDKVRLKDIERIIAATTMVNFKPNVTPDLYQTVYKEIHRNERKSELATRPKILPSILNYLSIVGMYSEELLNLVLDPDYLREVYDKNVSSIPRDVFLLDASIDLDCPNYKGNRLTPNVKYRLAKWNLEYTPTLTQHKKLSAYDRIYLDTMDCVTRVVGNEKFIRTDHVAPHFPRADIILCKDTVSGKFVEPMGFDRYVLGDLKYALQDSNLKWYAISVIGWNNTIRETSKPAGMIVMKQRHLEKLGYNARMVIWNQYIRLSRESKIEYIKSLLI